MTNPHSNNNSSSSSNEAGVQNPFLDFLQTLDPHGPRRGGENSGFGPGAGFPFSGEAFNPWGGWGGPWTGPPWARNGSPWGQGQPRRGRHDHDSDRGETTEGRDGAEEEGSPATLRESPDDPPASHPTPDMPHPPQHPHGPPHGPPPFPHHAHHAHPPFGGPGAHRPRGGGRGHGGRGGRGGPRRERHGNSTVPPSPFGGPFDFQSLLNMVSTHPLAQGLRDYVEQARSAAQGAENTNEPHGTRDDNVLPPLDIFNTEKEYVLHLSLPGAMKEDVGVHWDADKGLLNVAGVVYRPGNEEFLQSLTSTCERRVGMFERSIKLPPAGADDKDEVDAYNITAKMENGILIITVPKAEKEWTEIHKIDVE